ncbi:peptidase M18 [Polychytrium aggregatum]|uniref:peptidase M18 n=1 Tax=Polychytrium aggregatum TaxID=110093 RepID=UPI0022FDCF57|nr:peptidase M18 [Polychytrium aggregatum]KAI9193205.1 peptidase M18 [Polychytrium aggregatum]
MNPKSLIGTMSSAASQFIKFVNASPSPFHAVAESKKLLLEQGFVELKERDSWANKIQRNGKYFFTRNQSALIAFVVGGKYAPGNGFSILGAHTDSPCLKLKPKSKKESVGYLQVGVQTYGGGLWNTWFDRDLSIAGRVLVHTQEDKWEHQLVKIDEPILRIPTLAIHLDRGIDEGFKFNKEVQLTPILASASKALNGEKKDDSAVHHPVLLQRIAKELNIQADQIGDFEICLYDTVPATIGGIEQEYIFSARLDNLMMSFCSIKALTNSLREPTSVANDPNIRLVALFDNEEVGSNTAHGADSNLLTVVLKRIADVDIVGLSAPVSKTAFEESLLKSLLVSADMAHAVHPNYAEKHESNHRPQMNQGVGVKINANQRYATTAVTTLIIRELAKKRNTPIQEFVVRNDSPCGSTIGPMLSAKLGLRTVDIGNPQLSMHSIRETCGVHDVQYAIDLFESFFEDFPSLDARITVD